MSFGILFLIVAAGLLGPALSGIRKFSVPMVAGEILAGVLIGNSGLHWLNVSDPTLSFLASVGLGMLLFVVGSRLSLASLRPAPGSTASKGIAAMLITFAAAVPVGILLSKLTGVNHPLMFILLCAASSTSTIMPILNERHIAGPIMPALSIWIPIADMSTILALPLAMGEGSILNMLLGCLLVTGTGLVAYFGLKHFRSSSLGVRYRELSKQRLWALDLRMQLLILFGLAYIATKLGTNVLVAGFAAGIMSSLIGQPRRFNKQLTGLAEGLFVPLFFVYVGARIDMRGLFASAANLELCGLLIVAGLFTHLLASKLVKLPFSAGLIAAQTMGLPAAIVAIGLSAHVLTGGQAAAIVAAALVTLIPCTFGTSKLPKPQPGTEAEGDEQQQE